MDPRDEPQLGAVLLGLAAALDVGGEETARPHVGEICRHPPFGVAGGVDLDVKRRALDVYDLGCRACAPERP